MKTVIEGYLSKTNLKNFNTFYRQYNSFHTKKKFSLTSKSQKPNYFYQKQDIKSIKPINIISLPTEPCINQSNNIKKNDKKDKKKDYNLKNKIKQKLKLLVKTPTKSKNFNLNLKLHSENSNTINLDVDKSANTKNYILNFIDVYEKDFFSDNKYLYLDYNENEIYNKVLFYEDLIKKKVVYFRNKQTFNRTKKFEKKFYYGPNQKEIILTFNSLQITFQRMVLPSEIQNQQVESPITFELPFDLLPIFYSKGLHTFIKFLSRVIRIENNFEKIIFEEDKLCEELRKIKEFEINLDDQNDLDNSLILDFISETSGKNIIHKEEKKDKVIHLKSQTLNRASNFLKFSHFVFFWISNTKTYIVTISLPSIHLNILDNKIIIKNSVDYELLFYLYRINFENWEYYIIKNLSSYSKFRTVFQQINGNSKVYDKKDENIILKEQKQKINTFSDETLVNVYTDQFNKNVIIVFRSFHVLATITNLRYHLEKNYNLHFNFFQYIKLYEIAKYSSKIYFLIKFITANKEYNTLEFNFNEFDKFDIKVWMSNIKKFSVKNLYNNLKDDFVHEFDIFPNKIKVEYVMPKYSIVKIENDNEIIKTLDIGKDLEKDLVDTIVNAGSDSWTKFLNECLKKLNEPVPVLPSIHKRGHRKKDGRKFRFYSNDSAKYRKTFSKFNKYS